MRSARRGPRGSPNRKTGRSLSIEEKVWSQPTGTFGCCGMKIHARLAGEASGTLSGQSPNPSTATSIC